MKKIFSLLFSIAFLLVFVSLFSQKTLATNAQCAAAGATCIYNGCAFSTSPTTAVNGVSCDNTYMQCCKAVNAGIQCQNALGGVCWNDVGSPGLNTTGVTNYLYTCNHTGAPTSSTYCGSGCQINSNTADACKPAPANPACSVNWGTFPTISANTSYTVPITITSNFGINHPAVYIAPGGSSIAWDQTALSANSVSLNLKLTGYPAGTFTLKPYLNNSAGTGVECSSEKSFVSGCAILGQRCGNNNLQCCSGAGTCTSPSAGGPETTCQLGGPTATPTPVNNPPSNPTNPPSNPNPPAGSAPSAPISLAGICTGTTATLSWTNGTGATTHQTYYCDQTKAAAAGGCKPEDGSIDKSRWFYRPPGNSVGNDTSPLTFDGTAGSPGLTAGDAYQWYVAAANANGHTNSSMGSFTCQAASTCTPSTGTCTGTDSCSTTGSKNVTTCNGGVATTTQQACTLTPAASCNKPTAPVLGEATCDVKTPTSETLSWTNGTGATTHQTYYCDQTKAAAAGGCKPEDGSIDKSRWFYRPPGNSVGNDTSPLTFDGTAGPPGLTAGDDYQWLVAAANANGHTNSNIGTFTAGSCGGGPQPGLALIIGLDGIGHTGDRANADWTTKTNTAIINGQSVTNPVAGSNQSPKNPTRQVTLTLASNGGTPISVTGNVTFATDGANVGKYTGIIPYGATVKAGTYTVKVTIDGHLTKLVPGSITVTNTNTTVNVPSVDLVTGDITTPNGLAISDYNILLSCVSDSDFNDIDAHALCNQNASYKIRADTEDNDVIDKFDYNLFLREFSKVQAGD